jgi:hypothetical protein
MQIIKKPKFYLLSSPLESVLEMDKHKFAAISPFLCHQKWCRIVEDIHLDTVLIPAPGIAVPEFAAIEFDQLQFIDRR